MIAFVQTVAFYQFLMLIADLVYLATVEKPRLSRGVVAFGIAIRIFVLGWCTYLLCKG